MLDEGREVIRDQATRYREGTVGAKDSGWRQSILDRSAPDLFGFRKIPRVKMDGASLDKIPDAGASRSANRFNIPKNEFGLLSDRRFMKWEIWIDSCLRWHAASLICCHLGREKQIRARADGLGFRSARRRG